MPDRKAFFTLPLCRKVVTVVISPGGWTKGGQSSYETMGPDVEPEFKKLDKRRGAIRRNVSHVAAIKPGRGGHSWNQAIVS